MWVWLLMLFGIVLARAVIPDALDKKKKKLFFLGLSFLIIVFVVGSRSTVLTDSVDLNRYSMGCYADASTMSVVELREKYGWEYGYLLLNKILVWICPWPQFIVYFEAAFCTFVIFWFTYRNTDSVLLAVLSYVCIGPWQFFLTGFKQGMAICICLIALEQIKKRHTVNDIAGILLIALAACIHQTAWFALAFFIARHIKMTKITVVISFVITGISMFFAGELLQMAGLFLGEEYQYIYAGSPYAGIVPIAIFTSALLLSYFVWRKDKSFLDEYSFEIALLFIGLCLYTLRYNASIFERVSFYFTPILNIVLPSAIRRLQNKRAGNVWLVLWVSACLFLFVYRVSGLGTYHFFWESTESVGYMT